MARDFHHPYRPYAIQLEFMNAVYECIQRKQIGIFESPTGTGKSLSLICGSITWLRDHELAELEAEVKSDYRGEPQWVVDHAREERLSEFLSNRRDIEARLARIRAKEARLQRQYQRGEPPQKKKRVDPGPSTDRSNGEDDFRFLLDDYDSEPETSGLSNRGIDEATSGLSAAALDLLVKLGMVPGSSTTQDLDYPDNTKIFYCSRTHSQLTQFAHEVQRIDMSSEDEEFADEMRAAVSGVIRHLPLGSRSTLCINPKVKKLSTSTAINERCLELQQPKVSKEDRCAFLPNKENEALLQSFRDNALARVCDIEDLATLGNQTSICPYYASRATVKPSEIVTLPYPLMLQKAAREALGLSLKDHVVIIDEAHNLMDAIASIYSNSLTLSQLSRARAQLGTYLQKFRNKLKGKNRVYVTQVVRLIDSLANYLSEWTQKSTSKEGIAKVSDLMAGKGADQINLSKLSQYLRESKLARKVDSYTVFQEENNGGLKISKASLPVLTQVESFFAALNNPTAEGKFFYSRTDTGDLCLKYQLLDPAYHFKEIVEEARAVILAGGTMSPMDDYIRQLLPYVDPTRIKTLSCGHVIPAQNLLAWTISSGPGCTELDFTYEKRSQPSVLDSLGNCIVQLCRVIPDGLVVFFPSYSYLELVVAKWKSGYGQIWKDITKEKPVFSEEKGSIGVDEILDAYSQAINSGRGAIMLSVVGGKLSEGINFSDNLGRGIAIVGLPFPNAQGAEWKSKMEHIENKAMSAGVSLTEARKASRSFYENACMRAVNQSIGRAIRHKEDFASIIMLDKRYTTARIQQKLPGWIQEGLVSQESSQPFDQVVTSVRDFFLRRSSRYKSEYPVDRSAVKKEMGHST